jgi:hypothetical protein
MDIKDFLIGIGLFSLIAVVFTLCIADLATKYTDLGIPINVDENQSKIYDKASDINNQAQEMQKTLLNTPAGPLSAAGAFLNGAWTTLTTSFQSLSLSLDLASAVVSLFGLPPAITTWVVSSIIITLVITIAYMIWGLGVNR